MNKPVTFINKPLVPCAIFDIDGTLSNHNWRIAYIGPRKKGANPQKRFDKYHQKSFQDAPISSVVTLARNHHIHFHIIICTGRPVRYKKQTEKWLRLNGVPYKILMMRKNKDFRSGWEVKRDMILQLPKLGFFPKMIYDDDKEIIQMAQRLGIMQTFWLKGQSWKL